MDFRPNVLGVDPLPFLRDPSAFPPYVMRSFFKRFVPKWDGSLQTIPAAPSISFNEWDKQFRELINVVLFKNKFMTQAPEKPKVETAAAFRKSMEEVLTTTVIKKYGKSAREMNKQCAAERVLTEEIRKRLASISERLDDHVMQIEQTRLARQKGESA